MSGRKKSNQLVMWIVLAVMVVAMAGFGLNSTLSSSRGTAVLKVGKTEISADEYAQALSAAINNVSNQQGQPLSMKEARLMGIPQQIKNQLINEATLSEIARRSNVSPSDDAIAKELLNIEPFQDSEGKFSRTNFEIFLNSRGLTEDQFFETMRNDMERGLVVRVLDGQDLQLPNLKNSLYESLGEKRSVSFITLTPSILGDVPEPSDAEVRAVYDADPQAYLGEPKRRFEIAYLSPDPDAISDQEVKQYYNEHGDEFGQEALYTYRLLSFPSEAAADQFYQNPQFESVAQERGLAEGDYISVAQPFSTLPESVQEVLKDGKLKLYPPIQTLLGWNVYELTDYSPASQKPLESVEGRIRNQLASNKVNDQLTPEYDQIVNSVASGATPEQLADESPLTYVVWSNSDEPIIGLTDQSEFLDESKGAALDEERDLVKLSNGGVFILRLVDEEAAKPLPFEDVEERIRTDLKREAVSAALDEKSQELVETAQSDGLASVAAKNDVGIEIYQGLTTDTSYDQVPFGLAFDLFNKDAGEIWVSQGNLETRYLAQITDVQKFDPQSADGQALVQKVSSQVDNSITEGMIIDYLNAAAAEFGALEYPALIEQVEAQIR